MTFYLILVLAMLGWVVGSVFFALAWSAAVETGAWVRRRRERRQVNTMLRANGGGQS